jgi:hypothetical protein
MQVLVCGLFFFRFHDLSISLFLSCTGMQVARVLAHPAYGLCVELGHGIISKSPPPSLVKHTASPSKMGLLDLYVPELWLRSIAKSREWLYTRCPVDPLLKVEESGQNWKHKFKVCNNAEACRYVLQTTLRKQ